MPSAEYAVMVADYERTAIGPYVAYYHRNLAHGIAAIDWQWMLDFADGHLK